jgi:hypothetical protein
MLSRPDRYGERLVHPHRLRRVFHHCQSEARGDQRLPRNIRQYDLAKRGNEEILADVRPHVSSPRRRHHDYQSFL